jgi:DNA polymerase (family X)
MNNQELAKIFYKIAGFLEIKDVEFKPQAYEKAAIILENLEEDVNDIYNKGGKKALIEVSGIGRSMAEKIEEYLKTGGIDYYRKLKKEIPVDVDELTRIEGIGPKTVKALYKKLKIKNIEDLEKAVREHKVAPLFGFGERTEQNILEGIIFLKRSKGRFLLGEILPKVKEIENKLRELEEVDKISVAGSVRRKKETIGDVDFLIATKKPGKIMDFFVSLPGTVKIWSKGKTKSSIRMKEGFDVDLRIVNKKSYGSALQYFTGAKDHNIATRRVAIKKGLKLNEYGVFRGEKMIAGWSEKGVYKKLGLDWIEPELREDRGEVEAAGKGKLPNLVKLEDIRGDLHCHSDWSGGDNSIREMARVAIERGYDYLGISDHTKFLRIENGLNEKQLFEQRKEIDKLNVIFKKDDFKILQGAEVNILRDGSLDINNNALSQLDYVIAGIHSAFKITKEEMTERIIRAMKNPYVKIISHPTGRIIKKRDQYDIDFDKILRAAKEFKVFLEINSFPQRLDLNDVNIKKAIDSSIKLVINTDSHHKNQLRHMEFGIAQARRGWAEKKDIINTMSLYELLEEFKG